MLNPDLHLNGDLFASDVKRAPTRNGFGTGLVELGAQNPNIVALCGDLTESTRNEEFAKKFPERYFQVGVAEQNMAAVAAGLAATRKIPFISSYATFSPGKNWETLRTTAVYNDVPVKIAGSSLRNRDRSRRRHSRSHRRYRDHAGIARYGCRRSVRQHRGEESNDRSRANRSAHLHSFQSSPHANDDDARRHPLNWDEYRCSGPAIVPRQRSLLPATCCTMPSWRRNRWSHRAQMCWSPMSPPSSRSTARRFRDWHDETGAFVTVEDHQVAGGLGGTLAEWTAGNYPLPIEFIGLQDTFAESGDPEALVQKYDMGADKIEEAVKRVLKRK